MEAGGTHSPPEGVVTYDTVHKGNSKHHKTDEKITHFAVHVSPSMFGFFH